MSPLIRYLPLPFTLAALAACSGGGSTPTPTPPPAGNGPPTFSSPATASAVENTTGTIYQAVASDPDGNPLTYSIAGGADALDFRITTAGALSFATPPDFEAPTDADGNNVYQVRIGVSDGNASATLDVTVTVTNAGPDAFRVARVGTGFVEPVFVAPVPDASGRVYVVERAGRIRILNPTNGNATTFLDLRGQVTIDGERGLLGLATAPDFTTSGTFYVFLTNLTGAIEVRRYRTAGGNRDVADPGTADPILNIPHPRANHNGGWIGFGPDGNLYVAIGDGGGGGDPDNNAQNTQNLLGKILRIGVAGADDFPADPTRDYTIPATNPFAGGAGGRPEIWAFGLRNPYRASFDATTGNLWIGDVGQGAREEIDLVRPTDGGANFGWRVMEGTSVYNGTPTASMVPPVAEYLHGSGPRQGNSVTGGYVYRGPVEALRNQYFFGDFVSANIWSIPLNQVNQGSTIASAAFILRNADFTPNQGTIGAVSSFGLDQEGNLYIVDFDGDIFRVEPQ